MRIYLAGKIGKNCWRHDIVRGLRGAGDIGLPWPTLERAIDGTHDYVGPFFVSCDHGCAHAPSQHGNAERCSGLEGLGRGFALLHCFQALDNADLVFAWIENLTAFGTLVEIGWAAKRMNQFGNRLVVVVCFSDRMSDEDMEEMWFASEAASLVIQAPSPDQGLRRAIVSAERCQTNIPSRVGFTDPCVYFAQESAGQKRIKVGHTRRDRLQSRIKSLQTGSPEQLVVRAIVPGGAETERFFHQKFAHLNVRGEWFAPSQEMMELAFKLGEPL